MNTSAVEKTPVATRSPNLYWRLWRQVPRELGFLALTMPIATVGYAITVGLTSASVGTVVTFFIGVFLFIGAFYVSRGFGIVEITRLKWAGRPEIAQPDWQHDRARQGFWGWLRSMFANGHYWLYLLHTLVINFIVSTITWTLTVIWVSISLGGLTYWFWQLFLLQPVGDHNIPFSHWVADRLNLDNGGVIAFAIVLYLVLGLVFLATLPFVLRGLTSLHYVIARGVLGPFKSDALRRELRAVSASRGDAISAEGHSLRRLERDIHDGPQQRLVRLQMDLAAAERQLDTDPKKAQALITEAMQQSKDALEELRALSRGFAPPILVDRGLVAALESAADRFSITATVVNQLPDGAELPQEVERNAYFVAVEALTNAVKHASASEVVTTVALRWPL